MKILCLFILIALIAGTHPAFAHPHLFISYEATVEGNDDGFSELHFIFHPHSLLQTNLTTELQVVGRPDLGSTETQTVQQDMSAAFRDNPFYLYLNVDGTGDSEQKVQLEPVENSGEDQTYAFNVVLPKNTQSVAFSLYDPTYYVSVRLAEPGAIKVQADHYACQTEVKNVEKMIWGILQTHYVTCGKGAAFLKPKFVPHPQSFSHPLFPSRENPISGTDPSRLMN